jgi:hypothetical protein
MLYDVLKAAKLHPVVFWIMTSSSLTSGYQRFIGIYCIHRQCRSSSKSRCPLIRLHSTIKLWHESVIRFRNASSSNDSILSSHTQNKRGIWTLHLFSGVPLRAWMVLLNAGPLSVLPYLPDWDKLMQIRQERLTARFKVTGCTELRGYSLQMEILLNCAISQRPRIKKSQFHFYFKEFVGVPHSHIPFYWIFQKDSRQKE